MNDKDRRLKEALEAVPGAKEAFLGVLRDPALPGQIADGVGRLMEVIKRGPVVGWLVAVAEVDDREARIAIAKSLQEAQWQQGGRTAAGAVKSSERRA